MKTHAFVLAILSAPAFAGGGGATGGALEITQLMNHAELVSQVGEAVSTTANTLQTAQATMQQLRQLQADIVSQMAGLPIDQVAKLAEAYTVMSRAQGVYKDAADVLRKAALDAAALKISPADLLQAKANAAAAFGGVYAQTYDAEQAKLRALADVSKDVQAQAATVQGIDANVKGLQVIAGQNVKVQALLTSLNDSIARANMNAAAAAQAAQEKEQRQAEAERRMLDARRKVDATSPGALRLPSEVSGGGK